jgi:hypothetical protein
LGRSQDAGVPDEEEERVGATEEGAGVTETLATPNQKIM